VWRLPFGDLLTGAYTYGVPVSYRISSSGAAELSLSMGTWTREVDGDEKCVHRAEILRSLLAALYPVISTTTAHPFQPAAWNRSAAGGLVRGHPAAKAPTPSDNVLPIDRILRALESQAWSVSILAAPEPETTPEDLRTALIADLAFAEDTEKAAGHELPVVKQFTELVEPALRALVDATTMGAWRTAVYLEADEITYPLLASVWRSTFSGDRPAPETIHVLDLAPQLAHQLSSAWAFPLDATPLDQEEYRHPFAFQTLLSSAQLAAYIHLPSGEVPGFWVEVIPRFDVSVAGGGRPGPRLALGTVVAHPAGTHSSSPAAPGSVAEGPPYPLYLPALSRHLFIAGVTGSGKTNTSLRLLEGLHSQRVPFLVIEPAKREYRDLALAPGGGQAAGSAGELTVFAAASNEGTPLCINPFEVEEGTTVGEHVDLLRAVFAASFGDMWSPLPQVLEQCMLRAYQDRGWDLLSNHNHRLAGGEDRALAFPTLHELAGTVDDIVVRFGFDPEARDRVRGSLAARISGLRAGSKGALFDTRSPLSMASLLGSPAILELERLADESDKAFLMGLLLIRLAEYRRGQQRAAGIQHLPADTLRHVLVIEEAHRLLANVDRASASDNTTRAQAVESFSNLLAEIRAYGQGIVVIDQAPAKLAPDVVRNTNLKIAHRIVEEADRKVLAGSMSMSATQMAALASLARGEAAVFGDGDDAPVLIHVAGPPQAPPAPAIVASGTGASPPDRPPLHRGCACTGENYAAAECGTASALAEQAEIRQAILRLATAALRAASGGELSSTEILQAIRRDAAAHDREELVIGCLAARGAEWLADSWGARRSWPFRRTLEFAETLRQLLSGTLTARAHGHDASAATGSLLAYQQVALDLHHRATDPYPNCGAICTGDLAESCLYRHAVASTLQRSDMLSAWTDARTRDESVTDGDPSTLATCATTIAAEILGPNGQPQARRAAALCFAQQAVAAESPAWPPWTREQFVDGLITQYDRPPPEDPGLPPAPGAAAEPIEQGP
jgi:hypothetical protein